MAPQWKVTGQRETVSLDPSTGNYAPMIEVRFRMADGTIGTVDVPSAGYNAETAREAIEEKVKHLAAVANLTSEVPS